MSTQHNPATVPHALCINEPTEHNTANSAESSTVHSFTETITTEASTPFTAEEIATTAEAVKKTDQQENDHSKAFDELLQHYHDIAAILRDLGNRFENLIQQVLLKVPQYQLLFTQVQTYKEWQQAHL